MRTAALVLARLASAAWVGAAVLFVVTSVREIRSPQFDSVTKDLLVALRFPAYYAAGFISLGAAFLGALVAGVAPPRRLLPPLVLGVALGAMAADYNFVFRPLQAVISPPGQARPEWFESYHRASMMINAGVILAALSAAVMLSIPARQSDPRA